jgi:Cu(I)/Ag(I) efflux system periplasmic protein CusF
MENTMQRRLALALALVTLVAPAAFAGHEHAGHGTMAPAASAKLSEGVVKKVDKGSGKITLAHGPLENLGMPGMTMAFAVKDAAWLDRFKIGDQVRFQAELVNGTYTVVRMDPAK